MDKYTVLKRYFGHEQFRFGQEELVDAVLSGQDAVGVMPTGGGKSLCYQIPALLLPGLTLVVSPLISLMKDQVAALKAMDIPAGYVNSSLSDKQLATVFTRARRGEYKLLYVAPERLGTQGLTSLARSAPISLVAVDEAHCVSQWGQDFRPSYLKIADFIAELPHRPVVAAFTATATKAVRQDMIRLLGLTAPHCVVTGFDRPNLFFDVKKPRDKMSELLGLVNARSGKSGIVYCATRAKVEQVCAGLCEAGIPATRYHAGLEDEERRKNQEDFQFDRKSVMVATNAFGMGIDKSNVSYVIHYNMPKSLEAYYQEAGRAGRDGASADCILFYSAGDITTAKFLLQNSGNEELSEGERALVCQQDKERLDAMIGYCKTSGCLRGYILDYFGQAHGVSCGNCGNCKGEYQEADITVPAQMILSCLQRVKRQLGYYVGRSLIVQTLRGGRGQRIAELHLDGLSTYGLMKDYTSAQITEMLEYLEQTGYVWTNPAHSTLEPTERAAKILFEGETVQMPVRKDRWDARHVRRKRKATGTAEATGGLFDALREVRTEIAQREQVPAYIVFSNAVLLSMSEMRPHTMEEFLSISGVGEKKAARYGNSFLKAIQIYEKKHENEI